MEEEKQNGMPIVERQKYKREQAELCNQQRTQRTEARDSQAAEEKIHCKAQKKAAGFQPPQQRALTSTPEPMLPSEQTSPSRQNSPLQQAPKPQNKDNRAESV